MALRDLKKNRFLVVLTNSYTIILTIFLIWIFFFDENTHLNREFNKEIDELRTTIDFYKKEIQRDKKTIEMLQDSLQLERFAREKYLMKKKNEDVYIIEFDTLQK
jgi:cell division protein FtsB